MGTVKDRLGCVRPEFFTGDRCSCATLTAMQAKETVRALLDRLSDDCTLQDVLYHLYVLSEVEQGGQELEEGRGIPHDQVARELRRKWQLAAK